MEIHRAARKESSVRRIANRCVTFWPDGEISHFVGSKFRYTLVCLYIELPFRTSRHLLFGLHVEKCHNRINILIRRIGATHASLL